MNLLHLPMQAPQHCVGCAAGNFTGASDEGCDEVVCNLGTHLALYTDLERAPVAVAAYAHVFAVAALSAPGAAHDFLAATSDAGDLTIFDLSGGARFHRVASVPFARAGLRRLEPGPYLAVSPCGRAVFACALEKYKVAFAVGGGEGASLSVGAPIEYAKSHSFAYAAVALDVGYESPLLAVLERVFKTQRDERERRFDPGEDKVLCLYEMDANINCVVKRGEHRVAASCSHIAAVPGPLYDCPGGVLAFCEGYVQYFPKSGEQCIVPIPCRKGTPSRILASASYCKVGTWFILAQNQFGDLFLVKMDEEGHLGVQYFDTINVVTSMVILKQGFLATFGESNSNNFYSISSFDGHGNDDALEFVPSDELKNLDLFKTQETMTRLTKLITVPSSYNNNMGDIISVHGSGNLSTLKLTRKGIPTNELMRQVIGGNPVSIRTTKIDPNDQFDRYILINNGDNTRIFEVLENGRIQDAKETPFLNDVKTLDVIQMNTLTSYSTIQIHSKGLHVISKDGKCKNWSRASFDGNIRASTSNSTQLVIVFDDSYLTLFEANEFGIPVETSSIRLDNVEGNIIAAAIPQLSTGFKSAKWLALATDQMIIYIMSISNDETRWNVNARQIVNNPICDLAFLFKPGIGQILYIGHENGVLSRTILDDNEGEIGTSQIRYLGNSPVKFSKIIISSKKCLLANASSLYLCDGLEMTQFASHSFLSVSQIYSSFLPDGGFVGITSSELCFFEIVDINTTIDTQSFPLPGTPRQIYHIPETSKVIVLLSDNINGKWISYGTFFDTETKSFTDLIHFEENLSVTSVTYLPSIECIAVGFAKNLRFNPRKSDGGIILLINSDGEIHHITEVEDIPGALGIFENYLLSGIGKTLRIYKVGMNQLLKKCESRTLPRFISYVNSSGVRIIVGDMSESYIFLKYDKASEIITPFCDDCVPRFPLSSLLLDRSTIATGDRFGNFTILRLPDDVSDEAEIDPSGVGMVWEHPNMCGTPNKFDIAVNYHIGDPITSLALSISNNSIIYGTVGGQIGLMIPFLTDVEVTICKKLEAEIRNRRPTLCGRLHEMFHSQYSPLKNVIDGELIFEYLKMNESEQKEIAINLQSTPFDISRLLSSFEIQV